MFYIFYWFYILHKSIRSTLIRNNMEALNSSWVSTSFWSYNMDAEKNKRERRRIAQQRRRQVNLQNESLQVLQNIQVNVRREIRSTQQQLRRTNQQQHQPQLAN